MMMVQTKVIAMIITITAGLYLFINYHVMCVRILLVYEYYQIVNNVNCGVPVLSTNEMCALEI